MEGKVRACRPVYMHKPMYVNVYCIHVHVCICMGQYRSLLHYCTTGVLKSLHYCYDYTSKIQEISAE